MDRPETIEETAELVDEAGGAASRSASTTSSPTRCATSSPASTASRARLDVLVNDIWGQTVMEWDKPVWESTLDVGLRMFHLGVDTHAITSHFAIPLLLREPGGLVVEVTDGTDEYNATNYRVSFFYDLAKGAVSRMAFALAHELRLAWRDRPACSRRAGSAPRRCSRPTRRPRRTGSTARRSTRTSPSPRRPRYVGRAVAALASDPDVARWNGQSLSSGQLAKVYGFTDLDGSQPDAWRYLVEVQDPGKPADVTGYR